MLCSVGDMMLFLNFVGPYAAAFSIVTTRPFLKTAHEIDIARKESFLKMFSESNEEDLDSPLDISLRDYDFLEDDLLLELLELDETLIPDNNSTNLDESEVSFSTLEKALLEGVVPADAGVGCSGLPGDYGFDPLSLSTKDLFKKGQHSLIYLLYREIPEEGKSLGPRPPALILRDYREAEIRHGRLAMLASIIWPLQEILDRIFLASKFGKTTIIYGGVTLPYLTLFMMLVMLLLGYLDIYAASIRDNDTGEAFLPGECFWDPLNMLTGAPEDMRRNMQRREVNLGRAAMIAVFFYILEEAITHLPLVTLPYNTFLFEPAFQIPAVRYWLDSIF